MHEIPQILYKGQVFACLPTGIEKIGYDKDRGEREVDLFDEQHIQNIVEYLQDMLLERRVDPE